MKALIAIVSVFWLAGCSLVRDVPPEQSYQLRTVPQTARAGACTDRVIRMALIQAPEWLKGTEIYYTADDSRFYRYTRARWEMPPLVQLQQLTENALVESGMFEAVLPYRSLAKNDLLLEIRLERMLQHIDAAGKGATDVMLYGVLVDQYSRRVIAQKTFRYTTQDGPGDVQSALKAWESAIQSYQEALLDWLQTQCASHPKTDRSDVDL